MRIQRVLSGMCVVALLAGSAFAQPGQPRRGGGGGFPVQGPTSILSIAEVQKELGLTEDQNKKIKETTEAAQKDAPRLDFQSFSTLSEADRNAKMAEFRTKMEESSKKTLEAVTKILDEKQNERFSQLRLQREGLAALARKDIAEKLALTQEQQDKLKAINEEARKNAPAFGGFGQNQTEEERKAARDKATAARDKQKADTLALLTAEQKATWEKLNGAEFKFPAPTFGGGGRRPGSGGERKRPESKPEDKPAEKKE